jgi:hypothetical protein
MSPATKCPLCRAEVGPVFTAISVAEPHPVQPPARPVQPPARPVQPPARPVQPPARPVQPPARPVQMRAANTTPLLSSSAPVLFPPSTTPNTQTRTIQPKRVLGLLACMLVLVLILIIWFLSNTVN